MSNQNSSYYNNVQKRYSRNTANCNYSYCSHYNERQRRCPLRVCFYERESADYSMNTIQRRKTRWEIEEEMKEYM